MPYAVIDDGSFLDGTYNLDLIDPAGGTRLSRNELMATTPADVLGGGFDGTADINLNLVTDMGPDAAFPTYRMDVNADWTFVDNGDPTTISGTTPDVVLNNVDVDLVSLLNDFLLPQLERMDQAFVPAAPVIETLGSEVPAISLLFSGFTYFDLITYFGSGVNETRPFIDAFNTIGS